MSIEDVLRHGLSGPIKGEPDTGLEDDKKGEFSCRNCRYFDADTASCGESVMMKKSKHRRLPNGRIVVGPKWCCEFVDRTGKYFLK